jgi:hypothetical protein
MHVRRTLLGAGITAALLGTSLMVTTTSASAIADKPTPTARGKVSVALTGLTDNKPVNPGYNGNVIFGSTLANGRGALQEYVTHGPHMGSTHTITTFATAPSDVAKGPHDSYWIVFGAPPEDGAPPAGGPARMLYNWSPKHHGTLRMIADLGAYAVAHPDPNDLENNPGDSNPYGLASLSDGSVLVADAAANAVRHVWLSGTIKTVAQLPVQTISTAQLGDPSLPASLPAEAVPTSVAVGPDGAWYVGELKGFPFTPGASRIWRIKPGTKNVTCDPTAGKSARCSLYASSLTSIIDITFDGHALYVLELAKEGVGAIEGGDPNSPPPPGVLLVLEHGKWTELAKGQIVLPGGVAANPHGTGLYVTDFQLVPQAGRLLKIS